MASRAWTSLKHLLLSGIVVIFVIGSSALPVQADDGGVCVAAFGKTPESLPDWLEPASDEMDLTTRTRYDLLVGKLLTTGLVDGSNCPSMGLTNNGSPNACGLETAKDSLFTWQNWYNPLILTVSEANGLPPKVIKALIAVESQFWPAADWNKGEIGLAQMTEGGADMLLANRPEYFQGVCRQVYGNDGCSAAYIGLGSSMKRLLVGQVLQNVDANCTNCAGGVSIDRGELAIRVLAEALNASCLQTSRTFTNLTGKVPSTYLSYEDYWRLVLANYHSGSGCLYEAIRKTKNPISWSVISGNIPDGCGSGRTYIRRIELQIVP